MRSRIRAFTLIELLVVVAIIALLIAILLPSLSNARKQARTVVCQTNMRSLAQAWITYATENNGALPGSTDDYFFDSSIGQFHTLDWLGTLQRAGGNDPEKVPVDGTIFRYMGQNVDAYKCPEDAAEDQQMALDPNFLLAGSSNPVKKPLYSYTAPKLLTGAPSERLRSTRWVDIGALDTDLDYQAAFPYAQATSVPWIITEEDAARHLAQVYDSAWSNGDQITTRHKDAGGVAHLDGHVSMREYQYTGPGKLTAQRVYFEIGRGDFMSAGPWRANDDGQYNIEIKFGYILKDRDQVAGWIKQ